MNYSGYHKVFADNLSHNYNINKQNVLDDPQNYLGPNYKEVLNLWFYWESLSDERREVYRKKFHKLGIQIRTEANTLAKELASEVIDHRVIWFHEYEDLEIIAAHLYLERNIPFTFLPLIFDL
jgi:hypothetical protein